MFFFVNDTATTEIYTLSLHDALPISSPTAPTKPSTAPNDRAETPFASKRGWWCSRPYKGRSTCCSAIFDAYALGHIMSLSRRERCTRAPFATRPRATTLAWTRSEERRVGKECR